MGFIGDWTARWWLYVRWRFVKAIEIKPFLQADPNEYCPVCGARDGQIAAFTDGNNTVVRHQCAQCRWVWDTSTVTEIMPAAASVMVRQQEEEAEEENPEKERRYQPRFVRIPPVGKGALRVNGEELKDKQVEEPKKGLTATIS